MKILRKQFSNIDWKKVKEDLEVVGGVGILSSIITAAKLKQSLGFSTRNSILGGLGVGIGLGALTHKILGHKSYTKDAVEKDKKRS